MGSSEKTRPAAAQAKPPVAEKPVSSRTQGDQSRGSSPSVQKQREGIGFIRKQGARPGGPRQSLAVQGELFAERSRPVVNSGGRRSGVQSAPEPSTDTTSSNEPKRKKTV